MEARNAVHANYLKMKPIMLKHFPHLFGKVQPMVMRDQYITFFLKALKAKKVTRAGNAPITGAMVANFFRCCMSRREYAKALTQSTHYINEVGTPVMEICMWDKAEADLRYRNICRKQKIKE